MGKKRDLKNSLRSHFESTGSGMGSIISTSSNKNFDLVPLSKIHRNENQPRVDFDPIALEELATSIKIHGLIQPITVKQVGQNSYQIISGERRFRASNMAGLKEIPVYIISDKSDLEMLELALVENVMRDDLNVIELGLSYKHLIDKYDYSHEKLAERVGRKRSTITNVLRLLELPAEIQRAIREHTISNGHAKALAGLSMTPDIQMIVFKEVVDKGLSVHATGALIQSMRPAEKSNSNSNDKDTASLPAEYIDIQDRLRAHFGIKSLKIKVNEKGKGQIVIPFKNTKQFNEITLDKIIEK